MTRRAVAGGLLVLLAALWTTWPGASLAWLAVLTLGAPAVLLVVPKPRLAPFALAAPAFATALLPAGLFEWRPWVTAALLVALFIASFDPPGPIPRRPRASLVVAVLALGALVAILRVWTPTRDALSGQEGAVAAVMALGAAGLALVIVLASEEGGDQPPEAAAGEP